MHYESVSKCKLNPESQTKKLLGFSFFTTDSFLLFVGQRQVVFSVFCISFASDEWFSAFSARLLQAKHCFSLNSCFPPWGKFDFRWILIFPREGKLISADFWFSLVAERRFSLISVHRTPTKASFFYFSLIVLRIWAAFSEKSVIYYRIWAVFSENKQFTIVFQQSFAKNIQFTIVFE